MPDEVVGDWWPEAFRDIAFLDPMASDPVVVAEHSSEQHGAGSSRVLATALVPPDVLPTLAAEAGGLASGVQTNGPHPTPPEDEGRFQPRFWMWGGQSLPDGLEPLVVSWHSGGRVVLLPDQGFLMTYGLTPQVVGDGEGSIRWHDSAIPRRDVVICQPVADVASFEVGRTFVTIARDFLEDYATLRGLAMLQTYLESRRVPATPDLVQCLNGQQGRTIILPGRRLNIVRPSSRDAILLVQIEGTRVLLQPGRVPVSGRWEQSPPLDWPGVGQIRPDDARRLVHRHVYVKDTVLHQYEGRPAIRIHPEQGSVGYEGHWSVGDCHRAGRDLLRVELRKLYEGAPIEVIRHWHAHSCPTPPEEELIAGIPNVALRAKRVVQGVLRLGDILAHLHERAELGTISPESMVGLLRSDLEYRGWWTPATIEPITRHIPKDWTVDEFLKRCDALAKLVVESLSERHLRSLVDAAGVTDPTMKRWRSLKLLEALAQHGIVADQSGLELFGDKDEIEHRRSERPPPTPVNTLRQLNELRNLADHNSSDVAARIDTHFGALGMPSATTFSGWGIAMDEMYDRVGDALERIGSLFAV